MEEEEAADRKQRLEQHRLEEKQKLEQLRREEKLKKQKAEAARIVREKEELRNNEERQVVDDTNFLCMIYFFQLWNFALSEIQNNK